MTIFVHETTFNNDPLFTSIHFIYPSFAVGPVSSFNPEGKDSTGLRTRILVDGARFWEAANAPLIGSFLHVQAPHPLSAAAMEMVL
jgi:hypothetical protein